MLVIQRPTVEAIGEAQGNRQTFAVSPLEPGFGHTLGNSLRRTLLSSIPGAAITQLRFDDALHEFDTIAGVTEDVTDVILNPSLEIANLSDKGKLELTLTIGRGRGYVPAELNRGPEHTIGVIPVDSIFSPVRRVAYDVEAARVGQRTDYDKLRLDVTTDGSINPRDAIGQAAEILIRQLAIFTDLDRIEGFAEVQAGEAGGGEAPAAHGMENFPIEELELGVRSYNCLKRVGIETIGDLVSKSENELAAIPNFGKKSIEEVKETLATQGLSLRGDE